MSETFLKFQTARSFGDVMSSLFLIDILVSAGSVGKNSEKQRCCGRGAATRDHEMTKDEKKGMFAGMGTMIPDPLSEALEALWGRV